MLVNSKNDIINIAEHKTTEKEIVFGVKKVKGKRGRPKKIITDDAVLAETDNEIVKSVRWGLRPQRAKPMWHQLREVVEDQKNREH
jgi:hypothetical protein